MYHQIILRAFESLHGMSKKRKNEDESCAITEFMKDTCPETFQKVLRVRAAKTMEFFSNDETLPKLFLSTLSVTPMEKLMFQFLQWQKTDAYLRTVDPPMVTMAHPISSPACKAIRTLCGHMTTGKIFPSDPDSFSIMEIAQCFSAGVRLSCALHCKVAGMFLEV